jgi:hypothetical protein
MFSPRLDRSWCRRPSPRHTQTSISKGDTEASPERHLHRPTERATGVAAGQSGVPAAAVLLAQMPQFPSGARLHSVATRRHRDAAAASRCLQRFSRRRFSMSNRVVGRTGQKRDEPQRLSLLLARAIECVCSVHVTIDRV